MIYCDYASTSFIKPESVIQAVCEALKNGGNAHRGNSQVSLGAAQRLFEARRVIGSFFHAEDTHAVLFTSGATESLNMAIHGLFEAGDRVVTTELEHNAVLRPLYAEQARGVHVDFIPVDDKGYLSIETIEEYLKKHPKAIVCTHGSNVTGQVLPLERIGELCQQYGVLLVVDAAQTAGCIPIDCQKMHIDILCFAGHKGLYGPMGVGGLCIRRTLLLTPWKQGGTGIYSALHTQPESYPERLEAGTANLPGIAGLLAGIAWLKEQKIEDWSVHARYLLRELDSSLQSLPHLHAVGDWNAEEDLLVRSFWLEGVSASDVAQLLEDQYGVITRCGLHCAPKIHEALGIEGGTVRLSFSSQTTIAMVRSVVHALQEITRHL